MRLSGMRSPPLSGSPYFSSIPRKKLEVGLPLRLRLWLFRGASVQCQRKEEDKQDGPDATPDLESRPRHQGGLTYAMVDQGAKR